MTFSRRKNNLAVILALSVFPVSLWAQETVSPLIFDSYGCDFGTVEEAEGTLFQTFHFINGSGSPVRIMTVSGSCSCVSASYPQEIIQGGSTGEISVAFNPARTAGEVIRTVDVMLTDGRPGVTLTLRADVIPSEYDLEELYPVTLTGGIRITTLSQRFGYVTAGGMAERRIDLVNTSAAPVTIKAEPEVQGGFLSVASPQRLGPGEAGSMILRYTLPDGKDGLGAQSDQVTFVIDGKPVPRQVQVSCIGIGRLAEAGGHSPSLTVRPASPEMKGALLGKGYSGTYTISNEGASNLVILKEDLPAGVSSDLPEGTVLKPGASMKVNLKSGTGNFRFGLVTNDPRRPYKEISAATRH